MAHKWVEGSVRWRGGFTVQVADHLFERFNAVAAFFDKSVGTQLIVGSSIVGEKGMDHDFKGRDAVFEFVYQLRCNRIRQVGIEDDKIQRVRVKGPFQNLDTTFGQAYTVALGFEFPLQESADMGVAIGDHYVFE